MNSLSIMFKLFFLYDDVELSTYEKTDKHILLFVFIGIAFFLGSKFVEQISHKNDYSDDNKNTEHSVQNNRK